MLRYIRVFSDNIGNSNKDSEGFDKVRICLNEFTANLNKIGSCFVKVKECSDRY